LSPQDYVLIVGEHHFQREERNGEELDAIDLFKVTHHSKKDGFSEEAKAAIVSDLCIS
jgi:hypothetical protein